jgi:G3E family GTPase
VLSGFSARATTAVTEVLLAADRELVLVRHDLSGLADGLLHRFVCTADELLESATVELVHGCVSCSLREDVLPTLVRLARSRPDSDQLLVLPEVVEPEQIASACMSCTIEGRPMLDWVRLGTFAAAIDGETFFHDVTCDDDLGDRGRKSAPDDDRAVAGVILRQLEFSDVVLVAGDPDVRLPGLVNSLAPWTELRPAAEATSILRRPDRDLELPSAALRGLEGLPAAADGTMVFAARRPFHPGRFDAILPKLIDQTIRGRGHLWLASQPDMVVAYESHGCGVSMGTAGRWLVAAAAQDWDDVSPGRRTAASLGWDDYFGDRGIELVFVDLDADRTELRALLNSCLLTDAELALGQDAWLAFDDPFAGCFS